MSNLDRSINGLQPGPQPPGQPELSHPVDHWLRRFQSGNLGSLPVVAGVLAVCVIFGLLEPRFLSERNFVNLILQMAGIFATAIGVVFVLLVAEVDLSIAYVGAVGSITMTLLLREDATDWSWWLAIGVALLLTALIGLLHGFIITKAHAPSFVVTLAGLLVWNGVVLILTTQFSTSGTIAIHNPIVLGIANSYLNHMWSWMIYGLSLAVYSVLLILKRYFQLRQNVPATPISLALLVFWSAVATQTRFGRYVYAVGGNPEAARRAGIDVDWIRIVVFMISGLMAGVGGIILASRLRSVDTNTGGANLLLNAIAAAIIGGTSLFGGRGKVSNALLGALTIATVENGMGLLGLPSGVRIVINGIVLLAAVLVDTLSRHQRGHLGS
jgi:D-xylose transport system permease protein